MVSAADPSIPDPVAQIHERRRVEDPGILGFTIAVLAFTSSLERTWYVLNVFSSAPSRTIAARARLYTLEYCEIQLESFLIVVRDRV